MIVCRGEARKEVVDVIAFHVSKTSIKRSRMSLQFSMENENFQASFGQGIHMSEGQSEFGGLHLLLSQVFH